MSLPIASLTLLFALLWLPLGQQAFLDLHWMKVGAFIAPVLLLAVLQFQKTSFKRIWQDPKFLIVLLLIAYLVHQVEEHWIDIFGRIYALHPELNRILINRFGLDENAEPMTEQAIFFINTSLVWLPGFLAIVRSDRALFPAIAMSGLLITNGIAHVLQALASGAYNSGLLTALLLFFPLCFYFTRVLLNNKLASWTQIFIGIGWGALAHVVLFAGLLASSVAQLIPNTGYYAVLVCWAILPCFVYRNSAPVSADLR